MTHPTTYDRLARLNDLRDDLQGWGHIDLGTLLAAWGFRDQEVGVSFGTRFVLWYDEEEKHRLNVTLPSVDGLPEGTVERVIWIIDEVRQRHVSRGDI
jgi:hypothetical protein